MLCVGVDLELTTVGNDNSLGGFSAASAQSFHLLDDVLAADHLTEHNVRTVQPWTWHSGDKELRAVGVLTSVGHGQHEWLRVIVLKVLISELGTVDGATTGTVLLGVVTSLAHKVWNDSVEGAASVAQIITLLTSAQSSKVLCSPWHVRGKELKGDSAEAFVISGNVEEDFCVGHGCQCLCFVLFCLLLLVRSPYDRDFGLCRDQSPVGVCRIDSAEIFGGATKMNRYK